jgi:phosphoribosylamine--glycine ligase
LIRVLVVGAGGREHALAWSCRRSALPQEVLCAPGNGGTATIAENVGADPSDAASIVRLARERAIELVVLGPESSIAAGVADALQGADIAVFGPTAAAGRIETSKVFAKQLMDSAGVPTARWATATAADRSAADALIRETEGRCVVKADGPALGKGVVVCDDPARAAAALDACLQGAFGDAGTTAVVEERLEGPELSLMVLTDGTNVRVLPGARDYKRAHDGDRGPNTGGMGAVAPAGPDHGQQRALSDTLIQPVVDALRERGTPFRGCLYAGLILTPDGPKVLEYNARFGDPEAQAVLPLVNEDMVELMGAAAVGNLNAGIVDVHHGARVGVVAVADGYPGEVGTGMRVNGLDELDDDLICFHGATHRAGAGMVFTTGGRVFTLVGSGRDLAGARSTVYDHIQRLSFQGMRYRTDIGQ